MTIKLQTTTGVEAAEGAPGQDAAAPVDPVLREAAALAYRIAGDACRRRGGEGAGCEWYHRLWPTLRLIGSISGARGDQEFFQASLGAAATQGDIERILITGAADYAILEQLDMAFCSRTSPPRVTVVDRCETPLILNRWFADRSGLPLEGEAGDILRFDSPEHFDLILTHSIFSFIPAARHDDLVARWRALLRPGGLVVTSQVVRPGYAGPDVRVFSEREVDQFVDKVLRDAAPLAGQLPMSMTELAGMAREFARHKTSHILRDSHALEQSFLRHGFAVDDIALINRAELGYRAASPDKPDVMINARIVARAI
jgi:SAM-dependent methyltransferase